MRSLIEDGKLTAGHARTLVAADSPAELADQIIKLGLSVREAESLVRDASPSSRPRKTQAGEGRRHQGARTFRNASHWDLRFLSTTRTSGGTVTISYKTLEQLEEICRKLQASR